MKETLKAFQEGSHLDGQSGAYLESLYELYLKNSAEVPEHWRHYFKNLPKLPQSNGQDFIHSEIREAFLSHRNTLRSAVSPTASFHNEKQAAVLQLIEAYRTHGHEIANLDPLGLSEKRNVTALTPVFYQLSSSDLQQVFDYGSFKAGQGQNLQTVLNQLQDIYSGFFGVEYNYVTSLPEREWLRERIESFSQYRLSHDAQKKLLNSIIAAEGLEKYLHTKYVGQKRFSLEGGEALIPLLDSMIQRAGALGVEEAVIGMAHRGRLNVLVNILGKSPELLFREFEGKVDSALAHNGSGDVKYHLGFSSDIKTPGGNMHVALAFNPSHLEIVSPVVLGSVAARQKRRKSDNKNKVIPILIHGDAAFSGQGVVMETLNMSEVRGFTVGGSIHVVINNQIGFTTSDPEDMRSTLYCTDIAKMANVPVFHVNGDSPQAVLFVTQIALDYRLKFQKDVVIDLVCYRRHGHNEADEPAATQPQMYQKIHKHPTLLALYAKQLVLAGTMTETEPHALSQLYREHLNKGQSVVFDLAQDTKHPYAQDWHEYVDKGSDLRDLIETKVSTTVLQTLANAMLCLPEGIVLHPRVQKIMDDRALMAQGKISIDWGFAETLAYATLLSEGFSLRLTGQDSGRGTFFHRHAVLHDQNSANCYIPLQHVSDKSCVIIDSLLSEEAVLAYEYGYASTDPNALVIWEAQFGDFANGAQVVIDQFISSGEQKWGRLAGIVMLLPHGYEGQGPEHSSARLERYLQLCAQHNMVVCMPTTPAQIFHLLRRQMLWKQRKPLIVMTPKSLLRHKMAVSSLADLAQGHFMPLIPEVEKLKQDTVKRVVMCSGKVYFDLLEARHQQQRTDVALLRIEQLYPFPEQELIRELKAYRGASQIIWCQEEPLNQGAWYCSQHHFRNTLQKGQVLGCVGREPSASPAVGKHSVHVQQQARLVNEALG